MKHKQSTQSKINVAPVPTKTKDISVWEIFLLAAFIMAFTFVCFYPAQKNSFINWDDNAYVFDNPTLAKPIPEALNYFFGPHYFVGNYIPLTMMTYVLEFHLGGAKPELYHVVNILIHLLNVMLVFWFIYLLSDKKLLVAALVAVFFGIHPMHVESVAWVSELKDLQYTSFFLAGLICYYRYRRSSALTQAASKRNRRRGLFLLTTVFFILSVLSKPAAVVFPVVLLLLDLYEGRKFTRETWLEKLPMFAISVLMGVVAIRSQTADSLINADHSLPHRFLFACYSALAYIVKCFVPANQAIFYPYPVLPGEILPAGFYIAPFVLALLCFAVYRSAKHSRLLLFGFLFFAVNILLVLQLLPVGQAMMADRYTYVSYLGLFFVLAMYFHSFWYRFVAGKTQLRLLTGLVVAGLIAGSAYLTNIRCRVWKNDDTIATDLLSKFPGDWLAQNNKGFILSQQGRYDEAIPLYKSALALKPDYTMSAINLIYSYLALNDYDNALKTTDTALVHAPHNHNLLNLKGNLLISKQHYKEAIGYYLDAIRAKKEDMYAYINLAAYYFEMKAYDKGVKMLDYGLAYQPDNYILLNNKGYFLFMQGKYEEAIKYFNACLRINPDYNKARINLADSYKALGR